MLAYSCDPTRGSEPGAGWYLFAAALPVAERITCYTRPGNLHAMRAAMTEADLAKVDFVGLGVPRLLHRLARRGKGKMAAYAWWQVAAAVALRRRRGDGELVHHVTFASDWFPAAALFLAPPVVWGPVGGSTARGSLRAIWPYLSAQARAKEVVRMAATAALRQVTRRLASRPGVVVVANNPDTAASFHTPWLEPNVVALPSGGSDRRRPHEILFLARLEAWKGIHLAIDALSHLPDHTLTVLGDGPERDAAVRRAQAAGLTDRVTFRGHVGRDEVERALRQSACMLFPSTHDGSPYAVAEALAHGLPVICLPSGGPALMVERGGVGEIVPFGPDLPRRLADAVRRQQPRQPSDIFSAGRLVPAVKAWWDAAEVAGSVIEG